MSMQDTSVIRNVVDGVDMIVCIPHVNVSSNTCVFNAFSVGFLTHLHTLLKEQCRLDIVSEGTASIAYC